MTHIENWATVLRPLALSAVEEALYRLLLQVPDASLAELRREVLKPRQQVELELAALESKGLIARLASDPPRFCAAPPDVAIEAVLQQREQELRLARTEKDRLVTQLRGRRATDGRIPSLDLVRGYEATRQRWIQVQQSATEQVRIFDKPPYVLPQGAPNAEELILLDRGISYRVLYDEASFEVPGKLDVVRACAAAGEEARVIADVPMKLIIADRKLALTHELPSDPEPDGIVMYQSSMLDALSALFELLWDRATPFDGVRPGAAPGAIDATILRMLATGSKDEAIARRLGVGLRTVRRRVAALMDELDATTRFQAGVRAAQRERV